MSAQVFIYALTDESGTRYIGQTRQALGVRAYQHLTDVRSCNAAKARWIAELYERGARPRIVLLETTTVGRANERERHYIREARARGCSLVNGTLGGSRVHPVMADDSNDVRFSLRLPADVAAHLRRLAVGNDRSLNGEILRAIRAHLAQQSSVNHEHQDRASR